jgi:LysR family glycine cleavage system transcriptional activator
MDLECTIEPALAGADRCLGLDQNERQAVDQQYQIWTFLGLAGAEGNWNWKYWCDATGTPISELSFDHEFGTDDAALHACTTGLGVVLASPVMIRNEIEAKILMELPGYEAKEIGGYYCRCGSDSKIARQFVNWMHQTIKL